MSCFQPSKTERNVPPGSACKHFPPKYILYHKEGVSCILKEFFFFFFLKILGCLCEKNYLWTGVVFKTFLQFCSWLFYLAFPLRIDSGWTATAQHCSTLISHMGPDKPSLAWSHSLQGGEKEHFIKIPKFTVGNVTFGMMEFNFLLSQVVILYCSNMQPQSLAQL